MDNDEICGIHGKPLEIICVNCTKRICYQCGLFGDHKGHKMKTEVEFNQEAAEYLDILTDCHN